MKRLLVVLFALSLSLGAQTVETKRPTADADDSSAGACSGTFQAGAAMPTFYDASGTSTSSTQNVTASYTGATVIRRQRVFTSWQSSSGTYSALTLKVNSSCLFEVGYSGMGQCAVQYSTDGGSNWTTIYTTGIDRSQRTDSVTLDPSQNLSQLQVRQCVKAQGDGSLRGNTTMTGFDIWTEGTASSRHKSQVVSTE